ncbi:MAG: LacI family DNA-binding transcriptional regulator, partial [Anaerolineales bacterium]|nr:LacI family DNA-binding transcriptional regulator [Anaerolineales bacterium]
MTRKTIRNTKRKVTISDIARESDVSPATVSLVLRDKPGVGDDTRQRVWSTAQSLGYVLP